MQNKQRKRVEKLNQDQKNLNRSKKDLKNLGKEKKKGIFETTFNFFKLEDKRYTLEDSIPYEIMYDDGICKVNETTYNKMISFEDINYQLALEEARDMIFNQFANFLNSFDPSVSIQFCFTNQLGRLREMEKVINIPEKEDGFNDVRSEFREMLKNQLSKGNNGLKKERYIIFTVHADYFKQAKVKLERLEIEILSQLKAMGVRAESLDGFERLKIMHDMLNVGKSFMPTYEDVSMVLEQSNEKDSSKDRKKKQSKAYIIPSALDFTPKDFFKLGSHLGSASHFIIMASELSDRMLSEILSLEENMYVSIHIQALDQVEAIKMIKRKNTDIDKMRIEENKKAIRSGYDMDILPSDLITYGEDIKRLLNDLQSRDEKMFMVSFVILNVAKSKQKLDASVENIASICNRHNCPLKLLDHRQEQGLISSLPLGINQLSLKRQLTSSSTAVFMPFTTQELFMSSEASLYYGLNALSHNLIMADRKRLKNPNGLILGTPGSGKSFSAKREITNAILVTNDDIIVCDPEGEYGNLVKQFNGEVIKISAKSKDYLNPLDINMNYGDGDAPLKDKANFIMSMLELVVGGSGLSAAEKSVIDRCLPKIYEKYFDNPIPKNMPILQDLYNMLKNQEEVVGKKLATEMEIYVTGSLNVFNHHSSVDLDKKLLCFDIKELGTQLKKIGMLVIQDQVWNKVSKNRVEGKATRYYIDEFHLLLKEEQTAQYSVEIWKRFRKWGGIPTGLTQNVKDLLASKEIENIFDNTDFVLMLNQASGDREILAKKLKISPYQLNYVTNSNAGEGLLFFGNTIVPFIDKFPKHTVLYKKMTTKPEEVE
ncbi:ATP-binding protein [Gemella sp. zg-570]|uniref:VirB4-like conjugal transfer ATPase, CD1110 family n=1 Tax=Gemella sp. zg-570 TaxID=2840371 RepID=UPI001C0C42AE|nr:ATP-binding protein [Gemella sp. zg-570]QWQ38627.1 ATP-binding protein [Gemella sp. zg-570]